MTIIQMEALPGTNYHPLQSQSHRMECWLEGWLSVPEHLETTAFSCFDACELVMEDGVLTGLLPLEAPAPLPMPPSPEEDRDALLVDLEYRTTLLEWGVM